MDGREANIEETVQSQTQVAENIPESNEIQDENLDTQTDKQLEQNVQNEMAAKEGIFEDYTVASLLMGKIDIKIPSQVRLVRIFTSSTFTGINYSFYVG